MTFGHLPGVHLWGWDPVTNDWVPVLVNAAGKLIIDPSEIFEDTPTDGEMGKAPTSNWAHDHKDLPDIHHAAFVAADHLAIGDAAPHHAEAHTLASHTTKAHAELTGVGADDHHVKYTDAEALAAASASIKTPKVKAETRVMSAASGNVAYTGYGFTPTGLIIIAYWSGSIGSIGGSNPAKNGYSVTNVFVNTNIITMMISAGTLGQTAIVLSYDADGFTLTWTKVGAPEADTANLIVFAFK